MTTVDETQYCQSCEEMGKRIAELEAPLAANGEPDGFYSAELTVAMATIKRQAKCITQLEAAPQAAPDGYAKEALDEAEAALLGCREVLGRIANIQHALDLITAAKEGK